MKKRILSLLMALCMVVPLLAAPAAAAPAVATFSDVSDRETAVAVECLRLMGVLDGYGNNTFRPDGSLTRAQFCKMAVYAMNGSGELGRYRTVTVFPDVKPSHWAAAYINMAAKGKQIIAGFPDGKFHPDNTVSLGQAVTILMRLLGYKDEDVGGVWPQGHMASASTIGLTGGVGSDPFVVLTRGMAAQLFLNLLRSDKKEGGKYIASVSASTVPGMLASSAATANNGGNNAMQLGSGAVYQMANGKASNGILNGFKGVLALNKQGQVLTFVPESMGSSKVVTVASATSTQLTDTSGVKYPMRSDINTHQNGKEGVWSTAYAWLTPGMSVTLYIGASGGVEYVFVGGGSTANAAVIVYSNGSSAGFESITGGATGYSIYKNGADAGAGDMRKYDVATYSAATNSIRVCDTRITGIYENAYPTPNAPEKITMMDREFTVLPSAMSSLADCNVGSPITLLLTEDNQVAGAVGGDGGVSGNAIGIVKTVSTSSATVDLLCGITVSGEVTLSTENAAQMAGQLVRVSSGKAKSLSLSRLTGGVSGDLNVAARKLGSKALADNVIIFEKGNGGLTAVSLSQLTVGTVSENQISYAATDWAGRIKIIVLGNVGGSSGVYGRAVYQPAAAGKDATLAIEYGNGKRTGPFDTGYAVQNGDYVAATLNSRGDGYSSLAQLTKLDRVPNSAWSGAGAVTIGGRTYTVPTTVACYNKAAGVWVSLTEAHAFSQTSTLYADNTGVIRVVEVG